MPVSYRVAAAAASGDPQPDCSLCDDSGGLARTIASWQCEVMAEAPQPIAAGAPLALATVAGAVIGAAMGQPTIGLIAGLAIGTIFAIMIWLRDRAKYGR